jgi:uncharacterized short protein YbdD (DUF466 family)
MAAALWAQRLRLAIRRIAGAPDYDGYLRHIKLAHPHAIPLTERQFVHDQLDRRYNRPGSRCC